MENVMENYLENGYYIARNILSEDICNNIISELNNIKTDIKIPFTDIQFGYGNLINNVKIRKQIVENEYINNFLKDFYKGEYYYNSLYIHNKSKWVGPAVEWHQEVFNINTFHPTNKELTNDYILNNFMQIFIPLQRQNIENGGLRIIPKGHTLGILKCYDTLNAHLNHKRAILPEELDKAYDKCGILNLVLNPGDVLFFNHLLPHSSSSNAGPNDRKAMALLTYKSIDDLDEDLRKTEKQFRKNFAIDALEDKINKFKKVNSIYSCSKESVVKFA